MRQFLRTSTILLILLANLTAVGYATNAVDKNNQNTNIEIQTNQNVKNIEKLEKLKELEEIRDKYVFKYTPVLGIDNTNKTAGNKLVVDTTKESNRLVSDSFGDIEYKGYRFQYNFKFKFTDGPRTRERDIDAKGILSIPKEQKSDTVVILLHGRLGIVENSEYGFSYLADYLASNGYRAISLDLTSLYSDFINENELIKQAVLGMIEDINNNQHSEIITNKRIQFGKIQNIVLLGHSRAGDHIFKIADALNNNTKIHINKLISVAPCIVNDLFETSSNIDTTIVIPEFDGDVYELVGSDIYTYLDEKEDRTANTQLYFLFGGNHNYFNTAMTYDDGGKLDFKRTENERITRESQMKFLEGIVALDVLNNQEEFEKLTKESKYILRKLNGGYKSIKNMQLNIDNEHIESIIINNKYGQNELTYFKEPGDYVKEYQYLKFSDTDKISYKVMQDLGNTVVLDLALDSTTYKDQGLSDSNIPEYTISIIDVKGNIIGSTVYKPTIIRGKLDYIQGGLCFNRWTPIEQIEIPVEKEGLNCNRIEIQSYNESNLLIKNIYTYTKEAEPEEIETEEIVKETTNKTEAIKL